MLRNRRVPRSNTFLPPPPSSRAATKRKGHRTSKSEASSKRKWVRVRRRYRVINHGRVRRAAASLNNPGRAEGWIDQMQIRFISVKPDGGGRRSRAQTLGRKQCQDCVNLCPGFPRVVIARLRRTPGTFLSFVNTYTLSRFFFHGCHAARPSAFHPRSRVSKSRKTDV